MKTSWNRRQVLLATGAAASASIIGHSFLSPVSVYAATFTRKDVGKLKATDPVITSYAKAVTMMKARAASDPTSWTYQAAIHGTMAPCPCPTSWNTCEHGTEFFWSWHRMYLYYFEKIVRHLSEDKTWALPYWNWQLATERKLPAAFRNTTSALYTSHRDANMNAGTGSLANGVVDCTTALGDLDFSSAVEDIQTPHGNVHVSVGGWMGSVPTSAQDPIFYLHHSNVDRLWDIWLAQGGGRTDPLGDATWKGKTYTFFDENGHAVTMTDCDVLRAAQQLNYTYEGEPPQVNEYCLKIIRIPPWLLQIIETIHFPIPPIEISSDPTPVPVELKGDVDRLKTLARDPQHKFYLELDGIEAATQPGLTYQVFFGPQEVREADEKNPSYVGTFSLFGLGVRDEAHHGFAVAHFRFLLNKEIVGALSTNEKMVLSIVPGGVLVDGKPTRPKAKSTLHIGSVSVVVGVESREQKK